jgi:RNA recognition motif-containing protein
MGVKVYVGNLPFSCAEEQLKELFAPYGGISEVTLIKDKFSGRSKGFGFITFESQEAADKAIAEMNGKEIEGRAVTVNIARPMEDRPPRRNFDRNGGGGGGNRRERF